MREKTRENIAGYLFILPNLLGFAAFILFPMVFSFVLIFTDWDYLKGMDGFSFAGLGNIIKLGGDPVVWRSLLHNVVFSLTSVPVALGLGLLLAVILNRFVYMKTAIRTMIFLPYMSSVVAISVVWRVLYNPSQGPVNSLLKALGVDHPPGWLSSPDWSLAGIIIMTIWTYIGYAMILYMAGIQGISKDLYEASEMDGASGLTSFRYITVPMLKPTTFLTAVTLIISSFQVFASVQVMTNGGPMRSSSVLALYIYEQAFELRNMSYGATVSWLLFLFIFIVTLVQWRSQKNWQDQF